MLAEAIGHLMQFGVAGLMGALWVWERYMSRKREAQLDASHERIVRQRHELRAMVALVRRNTQAMERFDRTQQELKAVLERMRDEASRKAA